MLNGYDRLLERLWAPLRGAWASHDPGRRRGPACARGDGLPRRTAFPTDRLTGWSMKTLSSLLLTWGIPGLCLIAFIDSAGVAIPCGPDAVVMLLSWQRPSLAFAVVLTAAIGSAGGTWLLYHVGRKGGEVALARFDPGKRVWVAEKLRRNDVLAVSTAMVFPPPLPTKIFVLMAGAFGMPMRRFMPAVLGGRLVRYSVEAYLGMRFGHEAAEILTSHYGAIALVLVAAVVCFLIARHLWSRRRAAARTP